MTNEEKLNCIYGDLGYVYCIKRDLVNSAENACSIGFYLNELNKFEYWRLTDRYKNYKPVEYYTKSHVLKLKGYTYYDFCKDEFNLSRRSVDRFINIYIAFAHINKDSGIRFKYIDEKFKNYNCSQLSEMLGLNDKKMKLVSPDMSVKEIRSLKNEVEVVENNKINEVVNEQIIDNAINVSDVNIVFDKDFEDKVYKKKKYHVAGLLYDKFVSSSAQYSQQFIKIQEYLNKGYLARIVLYEPDQKEGDQNVG